MLAFKCIPNIVAAEYIPIRTYPVGSAEGLEVDTVAFGGGQGWVGEASVALVVAHRERFGCLQIGRRQLRCHVVRRVGGGGVAEAEGRGKALGVLRGGST